MSFFERNALESDGRSKLASSAEPDTALPKIPYRTSIQHSYYFSFPSNSNISTIGGSVLYAPVLYPAPPFPGGIAGIQAESGWLVGIGRIPGGFPPHSQ